MRRRGVLYFLIHYQANNSSYNYQTDIKPLIYTLKTKVKKNQASGNVLEMLKILNKVKDYKRYVNQEYKLKTIEHKKKLMDDLIFLNDNYPNQIIRDKINELINDNKTTKKILADHVGTRLTETLIENKNKISFYEYQGFRPSYYRTKYESVNIKNLIKNLSNPDFYEKFIALNEQIYKFYEYLQKSMHLLDEDQQLVLDQDEKDILFGIIDGEKDTLTKNQLFLILNQDIFFYFGKLDELGILKNILLDLVEIINSNHNIIYNDNSMKGGASENLKTTQVKRMFNILLNRNPELLSNIEPGTFKEKEIVECYKCLFDFFKINLKDKYLSPHNKLFLNNIISFLEFLVKIGKVGTLVFTLKDSKVNIIMNKKMLDEKITILEAEASLEENFFDTSDTDIDPLYKKFIIKSCLDYGKDYIEFKKPIQLKNKETIKNEFTQFIRFNIPELYQNEFIKEADKDTIKASNEKLLKNLEYNITADYKVSQNFDKINKIFQNVEFDMKTRQVIKVFGKPFNIEKYKSSDMMDIIEYNGTECKFLKNSPNFIDNIKGLNIYSDSFIGSNWIVTATIKFLDEVENQLAENPFVGGSAKSKNKKTQSKKTKSGKISKKNLGLCAPKYGNCDLFPGETHAALIPYKKRFKNTSFKKFSEQETLLYENKLNRQLKDYTFVYKFYEEFISNKKISEDESDRIAVNKYKKDMEMLKFARLIIKIYFAFQKIGKTTKSITPILKKKIKIFLVVLAYYQLFIEFNSTLEIENSDIFDFTVNYLTRNTTIDKALDLCKTILNINNHDNVSNMLGGSQTENEEAIKQFLYLIKPGISKGGAHIGGSLEQNPLDLILFPKITQNGIYNFREIKELYLKMKYMNQKTKSGVTPVNMNLEDCDEFKVRDLGVSDEILNPNENKTIDDFIIYFDRRPQNNINVKFTKFKEDLCKFLKYLKLRDTQDETPIYKSIAASFSNFADTKNSIFQEAESGNIKYYKYLENTADKKLINSCILKSVILSENIFNEFEASEGYYITILNKKYEIKNINLNIFKKFIGQQKINLKFIDFVILYQNIYFKDNDSTEVNTNIKLLDVIDKHHSEIFIKLVFKKLFEQELTDTIKLNKNYFKDTDTTTDTTTDSLNFEYKFGNLISKKIFKLCDVVFILIVNMFNNVRKDKILDTVRKRICQFITENKIIEQLVATIAKEKLIKHFDYLYMDKVERKYTKEILENIIQANNQLFAHFFNDYISKLINLVNKTFDLAKSNISGQEILTYRDTINKLSFNEEIIDYLGESDNSKPQEIVKEKYTIVSRILHEKNEIFLNKNIDYRKAEILAELKTFGYETHETKKIEDLKDVTSKLMKAYNEKITPDQNEQILEISKIIQKKFINIEYIIKTPEINDDDTKFIKQSGSKGGWFVAIIVFFALLCAGDVEVPISDVDVLDTKKNVNLYPNEEHYQNADILLVYIYKELFRNCKFDSSFDNKESNILKKILYDIYGECCKLDYTKKPNPNYTFFLEILQFLKFLVTKDTDEYFPTIELKLENINSTITIYINIQNIYLRKKIFNDGNIGTLKNINLEPKVSTQDTINKNQYLKQILLYLAYHSIKDTPGFNPFKKKYTAQIPHSIQLQDIKSIFIFIIDDKKKLFYQDPNVKKFLSEYKPPDDINQYSNSDKTAILDVQKNIIEKINKYSKQGNFYSNLYNAYYYNDEHVKYISLLCMLNVENKSKNYIDNIPQDLKILAPKDSFLSALHKFYLDNLGDTYKNYFFPNPIDGGGNTLKKEIFDHVSKSSSDIFTKVNKSKTWITEYEKIHDLLKNIINFFETPSLANAVIKFTNTAQAESAQEELKDYCYQCQDYTYPKDYQMYVFSYCTGNKGKKHLLVNSTRFEKISKFILDLKFNNGIKKDLKKDLEDMNQVIIEIDKKLGDVSADKSSTLKKKLEDNIDNVITQICPPPTTLQITVGGNINYNNYRKTKKRQRYLSRNNYTLKFKGGDTDPDPDPDTANFNRLEKIKESLCGKLEVVKKENLSDIKYDDYQDIFIKEKPNSSINIFLLFSKLESMGDHEKKKLLSNIFTKDKKDAFDTDVNKCLAKAKSIHKNITVTLDSVDTIELGNITSFNLEYKSISKNLDYQEYINDQDQKYQDLKTEYEKPTIITIQDHFKLTGKKTIDLTFNPDDEINVNTILAKFAEQTFEFNPTKIALINKEFQKFTNLYNKEPVLATLKTAFMNFLFTNGKVPSESTVYTANLFKPDILKDEKLIESYKPLFELIDDENYKKYQKYEQGLDAAAMEGKWNKVLEEKYTYDINTGKFVDEEPDLSAFTSDFVDSDKKHKLLEHIDYQVDFKDESEFNELNGIPVTINITIGTTQEELDISRIIKNLFKTRFIEYITSKSNLASPPTNKDLKNSFTSFVILSKNDIERIIDEIIIQDAEIIKESINKRLDSETIDNLIKMNDSEKIIKNILLNDKAAKYKFSKNKCFYRKKVIVIDIDINSNKYTLYVYNEKSVINTFDDEPYKFDEEIFSNQLVSTYIKIFYNNKKLADLSQKNFTIVLDFSTNSTEIKTYTLPVIDDITGIAEGSKQSETLCKNPEYLGFLFYIIVEKILSDSEFINLICQNILNYLFINPYYSNTCLKTQKSESCSKIKNYIDLDNIKSTLNDDDKTQITIEPGNDAIIELNYDREIITMGAYGKKINKNKKLPADTPDPKQLTIENSNCENLFNDIIDNKNVLLFTFGVTGAGKGQFKDTFDKYLNKSSKKQKIDKKGQKISYYLGEQYTYNQEKIPFAGVLDDTDTQNIEDLFMSSPTIFNPNSTRGFLYKTSLLDVKQEDGTTTISSNSETRSVITEIDIPGFESFIAFIKLGLDNIHVGQAKFNGIFLSNSASNLATKININTLFLATPYLCCGILKYISKTENYNFPKHVYDYDTLKQMGIDQIIPYQTLWGYGKENLNELIKAFKPVLIHSDQPLKDDIKRKITIDALGTQGTYAYHKENIGIKNIYKNQGLFNDYINDKKKKKNYNRT